jgi:hypothetical protein
MNNVVSDDCGVVLHVFSVDGRRRAVSSYGAGGDDNTTIDQEKNGKSRGYKHVPHKDKPAQVVAKRNARERRRVQAVNSAFARLRKVVPVENARGKRISKVKTLQHAIDYIQALQQLLEQDRNYQIVVSECRNAVVRVVNFDNNCSPTTTPTSFTRISSTISISPMSYDVPTVAKHCVSSHLIFQSKLTKKSSCFLLA